MPGLEIKFFFQGAQLALSKLPEGVVYSNQYNFGLPAKIWGSCRRIRGSPGLLALPNFEPCVLYYLNPSNAEATFGQSARMQIFLKTILTLSTWYSLESSRWELSVKYPFARVAPIFQVFASFCIGQLATSSTRVNPFMPGNLLDQWRLDLSYFWK